MDTTRGLQHGRLGLHRLQYHHHGVIDHHQHRPWIMKGIHLNFCKEKCRWGRSNWRMRGVFSRSWRRSSARPKRPSRIRRAWSWKGLEGLEQPGRPRRRSLMPCNRPMLQPLRLKPAARRSGDPSRRQHYLRQLCQIVLVVALPCPSYSIWNSFILCFVFCLMFFVFQKVRLPEKVSRLMFHVFLFLWCNRPTKKSACL